MRSSRTRFWLTVSGSNLAVLLVAFAAAWPTVTDTPIHFAANAVGAMAFVLVGVIAVFEFRRRALGWCVIASGLLWAVKWAGSWNVGILPVVGFVADSAFYSVAGIGVLLYLSNGKLNRAEWAVAFALGSLVALRLGLLTFSVPGFLGYSPTAWWPSLWPDQGSFDTGRMAVYLYEAFLGFALTVTIIRRVWSARKLGNQAMIPVGASFCLAGLVAAIGQSTDQMFLPPTITDFYLVLAITTSIIPLGILTAIGIRYRQHLQVSSNLHRIFAETVPSATNVQLALQQSLNDPGLRVVYWSLSAGSYVDDGGAAVGDFNGFTSIRYVTTREGEPLAALLLTASADKPEAVLQTVVQASLLAFENARLHAEVQSQLFEVNQSRFRIEETRQAERESIARDLHDDVQQRLLAINARIGVVRKGYDGINSDEILQSVSDDLKSTLNAVRSITHGIQPPELRQFGLAPALSMAVQRMPLSVKLTVTDTRYSELVESASYFIVCEALSNVIKHSGSESADVRISNGGGVLVVEVLDLGRGIQRGEVFSGLRGLDDRVRALGGSLDVVALPEGGTKVVGTLPCA